jgi:hypothetical protein
MRTLPLTWGLILVSSASGCYIPGGGWTLRTGVDVRTYRKPGCYVEMVDTRWDEWNRIAQMNAYGGACPAQSGGPLVVESSVYAPGPTPIPGGAMPSPVLMTPPSGAVPPVNDPTSGTGASVPAYSPAMVPAAQPSPSSNQLPMSPPPAAPLDPVPPIGPPPPEPPAVTRPAEQPVARRSSQPIGSAVAPATTERRIARTAREIPAESGASLETAPPRGPVGPAVVGANAGPARTARTRDILFDTPLDPERNTIDRVEARSDSLPTPRANTAARRSGRTSSVESADGTAVRGEVELQGVVSEEPIPDGRQTERGSDARTGATDRPDSGNSSKAAPNSDQEPRPWWRSGFGLLGR